MKREGVGGGNEYDQNVYELLKELVIYNYIYIIDLRISVYSLAQYRNKAI